jgi:pilus assembly protein FimV
LIAKSHRWQKTIMAAAATALIGLYGPPASALSLGRITVQSALGEPLRAEIDVPDINAEEAASLQARAASPEAFQAAGLEYNPAMANLKVTLQRRANGRAYIRLSSDRAVNDPFVDMILEANWASGRIVRDYTMLFDPPALKQAAPAAPTAPQVPAAPSTSRAAAAAPAPLALPPARPAEVAKAAPRPAPPAAVAQKTPPAAGTMTVKAGDTAGQIAAATKPVNVSLDQMLVAILRANPDAFLRDNVNRIKAGAILNLPTPEQAATTTDTEARQIIVAHSKDFNDFRRKLAGNAPQTQVGTADRTASGSVTAQVQDKPTTIPTPDKLTLSKGSVQGQRGEDQLAKARSAQESANRAAEIAKNISDLSKLEAASSTVAAGTAASAASEVAPAQAASAPVVAMPTPAAVVSAAPAPPPAASAPKPAATAPLPPVDPGLMDALIEDPLVPAGAAALVALLAGLGFYRMRQRKNSNQVDSSFLESHLKPESFFGASGGQSIDTHDSAANGSALVYSHSQLDSADDVDPVAEADVYLAYGRDLQAEEILKEALRSNPSRLAIHEKLLEIFAKRTDTKGFEDIATQAFKLTEGAGTVWTHICEMGLSIDPGNALYQPGGQPHNADSTPSRPAPLDLASGAALTAAASAAADEELQPSSAVDLDLDLDFSLDDEPASTITEADPSPQKPVNPGPEEAASTALDLEFDAPTLDGMPLDAAPEQAAENAFLHSGGIDFSLPEDDMPASTVPVESQERPELEEPEIPEFSLDFETPDEPAMPETWPESEEEAPPTLEPTLDTEDFKVQAATSFGTTVSAPLTGLAPEEAASPDLGMLEFDLGSLSLDLDAPAAEAANEELDLPVAHEDPLATKLALAEEFSAIGDDDGARALIEEVISEATGDMKIKAQRALSNL